MDLLWPFRRKAIIILPHDERHFTVRTRDGETRPKFNNTDYAAIYRGATIDLSLPVRHVLSICGVPWRLGFYRDTDLNKRFTVYYTPKNWDKVSMDQAGEDCRMKVLFDSEPHLIVRAKDFIQVNKALEEYKNS